MGVLNKDENISSDMIDILAYFRQFVPGNESQQLKPVLCYGDELMCERLHNAQEDRRDSFTPSGRFEGIVGCIGDFHAVGNFLAASDLIKV